MCLHTNITAPAPPQRPRSSTSARRHPPAGLPYRLAKSYPPKLLRSAKATAPLLVTGGLAADVGLMSSLRERLAEGGGAMEVLTHPDSIYAGALGAALWGAVRRRKLGHTAAIPPRPSAGGTIAT